jgi:uncharacterized protein YndB with AHSA1/START domain
VKPILAPEDTIVQEIAIRTSAERIFDALTKPEELLKWWGAKGKFQATHVECDLRVGGKWKMRVESTGGETIVVGEYREIERPRLLVFTWIRENEDGVETLVRWDLEENAGATIVRVTHSGLSTKALRDRNGGWPIVTGLLKAFVEQSN